MVRVMLGRIFVMPTNVGPWAWDLGIRDRWWTGNGHRLCGCRVEVTIVDFFFLYESGCKKSHQDRDRHPRESWLFWEFPGGALTNGNQEHWNRCTLAWLWYRIDAFWLCFFVVIFVEGLLRWTKKKSTSFPLGVDYDLQLLARWRQCSNCALGCFKDFFFSKHRLFHCSIYCHQISQ